MLLKLSSVILMSLIYREVRSSRVFEDDFDPLNAAAATEAPKSSSSSSSSKMSKSCTASSVPDSAASASASSGGSRAGDPLKRRSMPPPKSASSVDGEQEKTIKVGRECGEGRTGRRGGKKGASYTVWQISCRIFDGISRKIFIT